MGVLLLRRSPVPLARKAFAFPSIPKVKLFYPFCETPFALPLLSFGEKLTNDFLKGQKSLTAN